MSTTQVERTPNPNSLKFTSNAGSFLDDGMATYDSKEEASTHPLAQQLFTVSGVENVFMTPQFVTISKDPSVAWNQVQPDIESILAEYLDAE